MNQTKTIPSASQLFFVYSRNAPPLLDDTKNGCEAHYQIRAVKNATDTIPETLYIVHERVGRVWWNGDAKKDILMYRFSQG